MEAAPWIMAVVHPSLFLSADNTNIDKTDNKRIVNTLCFIRKLLVK